MSFDACCAVILKSEGGFVHDPRDPGGATNFGITQQTLQAWRGKPCSEADVRALTQAEASSIYRANYWQRIRGDELPSELALLLFDSAVNSGPAQAIRWLQLAVGVQADGQLGPLTLAVVQGVIARDGSAAVCADYLAERILFLSHLPTWTVYGRGWARRVCRLPYQAPAPARSSA